MAATVGGAPAVQYLEFTVADFRGQPKRVSIPLIGTISNANVAAIMDAYDAISNGLITGAQLVSRTAITGLKGAAINALERNISEIMTLTFDGINTNGKRVARSVLVYAMKAAIETLDGSPVAPTVSAPLDALTGGLATNLAYQQASDSAWVTGLAYDPANSHHISEGDVVNTTTP